MRPMARIAMEIGSPAVFFGLAIMNQAADCRLQATGEPANGKIEGKSLLTLDGLLLHWRTKSELHCKKASCARQTHVIRGGCVAEIVNRLKGARSRILRQEFPHLTSKLPTLWSRSYYAGTVGHVSESTVKRYIESQKGR